MDAIMKIKDWSLQELLHRLLRAEASVAEWGHWTGSQNVPIRKRKSLVVTDPTQCKGATAETARWQKERQEWPYWFKSTVELELKNVKCYKCHKDGHIAKSCPNTRSSKPGHKMISLESSKPVVETAKLKSWLRIMTVQGEEDIAQLAGAKLSGPTFKVDVVVERLNTQAPRWP